jgi:hypothetical protein
VSPYALCVDRYIGFLTRCALSKPYPELSIVNTVNAMSLATGRISSELSEEVFGDSAEADQLAYAGLPSQRPTQLRSMPFIPVRPRAPPKANTAVWLTARQRINTRLLAELRTSPICARVTAILHGLSPQWDIHSDSFNANVCMGGVWRHVGYEKVWDYREDGRVEPRSSDTINRHIFACPCNNSTGIVPPAAAEEKDGKEEKEEVEETEASIGSSVTRPVTRPTDSSQRQPFRHNEVIAYGLVKRWIALTQAGVRDPQGRGGRGGGGGGTAKDAVVILAHVRIFEWTLEPDTGCPILQQRSRAGYEDHYMLAQHIVCRITLSPLHDDTSQYLVSHVL